VSHIKEVRLRPYNAEWLKLFERAANEIKSILGEGCTNIEHIGSTSVSGLLSISALIS
jgi:GrpB-like predicted nucleotidyltransferase (UPF0157 family)